MTTLAPTADTLPAPPPRPSWSSDVRLGPLVAEELWPEIEKWVRDAWAPKPVNLDELAEMKESAAKIIAANLNEHDGFRVAKSFEADYWEVDAALVEILDGLSSHQHEAHLQLVQAWVKEHQIKMPFTLGDTVSFEHQEKGEITGMVVKVCTETAQVVVNSPQLGNKPPKNLGAYVGDGITKRMFAEGLYVEAERVTLVAASTLPPAPVLPPRPWCVKHRDGWCALPPGAEPDPNATSDPTLCGQTVIMRTGSQHRAPDCPECRAALKKAAP